MDEAPNRKRNMSSVIKIIIRIIVIILVVFVLSVIVVNILKPISQKEISEDYKEYVSQTEYQSDTPGTERILCVEDNTDALLWRLRMIGSAKESIVLATFDFRTDNIFKG